MTDNPAESQIVEYKSSWRDEYLAWICGYANANGGTLYIGKDDSGNTIGLQNPQKLMEDLPNKIVSALGIVAEVNLHEAPEGDYIEIIVAPFGSPVNYKGEYHYRSGSTKQALNGPALTDFLLRKQGLHWDAVAIPDVTIAELNKDTLDLFRKKGIESKRLDKSIVGASDEVLLENLKFIDNGTLKRAAILMFHSDPEKYVTGAYIKIGFFADEAEILFQDEIHGNLIDQVEKTMELIFTKYTKALISYRGLNRIETYEYPDNGIKEAILNSVTHKRYASGSPIQIRVYQDRIVIWNSRYIQDAMTHEELFGEHASKPGNPDVATAFFRSGYVEAWGRGVYRMVKECENAGLPLPDLKYESQDFKATFRKDIYHEEYLKTLGISDRQIKALLFFKPQHEIATSEYAKKFKITDRTARRDLSNLVERELLKQVGNNRLIRYKYVP
jgi:ATP-dependent DNA helicase RecG